MKTGLNRRPEAAGVVLLTTVGIFFVVTLILGSYFWLIQYQNVSVARSDCWNSALAAAEAGVEEAMAQLNAGPDTNVIWTTDWGTPSGGNYGPVARSLSRGQYSVLIDMNSFPVIYSTGYTTLSFKSQTLKRVVRASTDTVPLFGYGMVALQGITFDGKGIYVDSYKSSQTGGRYNFSLRRANGDIASAASQLDVGNGTVKGKVFIGPEASLSVGSQGSVGDLNWVPPPGKDEVRIQPGWKKDDFNMEVQDWPMPNTSGWLPPTAPNGQTTNKYVLGNGNYILSSGLDLKNKENLFVTGKATLYVGGDISMNAGAKINIAAGAELIIIMGGGSATFTQVNTGTTNGATAFTYRGLPANTDLTWNGNAEYIGNVYAPEATFTLGGGGNNTYDYQGACIVKAVTMNGKFNFHYDEDLKDQYKSGYGIASWREL